MPNVKATFKWRIICQNRWKVLTSRFPLSTFSFCVLYTKGWCFENHNKFGFRTEGKWFIVIVVSYRNIMLRKFSNWKLIHRWPWFKSFVSKSRPTAYLTKSISFEYTFYSNTEAEVIFWNVDYYSFNFSVKLCIFKYIWFYFSRMKKKILKFRLSTSFYGVIRKRSYNIS